MDPKDNKENDLQVQYQQILDQYREALDKTKPTDIPTSPQTVVSTPKTQNTPIFKYVFYVSIVIFIAVIVLIINTFISTQKPFTKQDIIPTIAPTPTLIPGCEINDQKYLVGESFPATDGCNTCSCGDDLTIVCTEVDCQSLSPTPKSSVIKLNYLVPVSYNKITDIAKSFEVAYDPAKFAKVNSEDSRVLLSLKDNQNIVDIKLLPYNNGSRHTFLQNNLSFQKISETKEIDYNISGKSGLFEYNVDASATYAVGMVTASPTKAWTITTTSSDRLLIESIISTLKLL